MRSRVEDAAVGICINRVSNAVRERVGRSPVVYLSGPSFDYRRCYSDRTILDNPGFSVGFSLYTQFRRDLAGSFCDGVQRGALTAPGQHAEPRKHTYEFFDTEPHHAEEETQNKQQEQTEARGISISIPPWHPNATLRAEWGERSEWRYVNPHLRNVLGTADVQYPVRPSDQRALRALLNKGLELVSTVPPPPGARGSCTAPKVSAVWTASSWQRPVDVMAILTCKPQRKKIQPREETAGALSDRLTPSHYLMHATYSPSLSPSSFSLLPVFPTPLWLLIPFACHISRLIHFLLALHPVAEEYAKSSDSGTGALDVLVVWQQCERGEDETWREQVDSSLSHLSAQSFIAMHYRTPHVRMHIHSMLEQPFARANAINAGLDAMEKGAVAVVMDIDMRFKVRNGEQGTKGQKRSLSDRGCTPLRVLTSWCALYAFLLSPPSWSTACA